MPATAILEQTRPRMSDAEIARRKKALARADAHNRIEGIFPDPASEPVFQAWVRGEIDELDIMPMLKKLGPPV